MNLKHGYSLLHVWLCISEAALDSYKLQAAFDPQSCIFDWKSFDAQVFKNNRTLVTNLDTLRGFTHKQSISRSDNMKPVLLQKPGEKM